MSAVTDLLDQLAAGRKTVDEVADAFRTHQWPVARPPARDGDEAFTRMLEDPETPPDGDFFEVSLARSMGQITMDQYEVLAEAAAEGMRGGAEDDTAGLLADDEADLPPAGGVDPDDED